MPRYVTVALANQPRSRLHFRTFPYFAVAIRIHGGGCCLLLSDNAVILPLQPDPNATPCQKGVSNRDLAFEETAEYALCRSTMLHEAADRYPIYGHNKTWENMPTDIADNWHRHRSSTYAQLLHLFGMCEKIDGRLCCEAMFRAATGHRIGMQARVQLLQQALQLDLKAPDCNFALAPSLPAFVRANVDTIVNFLVKQHSSVVKYSLEKDKSTKDVSFRNWTGPMKLFAFGATPKMLSEMTLLASDQTSSIKCWHKVERVLKVCLCVRGKWKGLLEHRRNVPKRKARKRRH